MTVCPDKTRIIEYTEGELTEAEAAEVRRHLKRCSSCADTAMLWASLRTALRQDSESRVDEGFAAAIMQRVSGAPMRSPWQSFCRLCIEWRPQLIAIAASFLVVLIQVSLDGKTAETTASISGGSFSCELLAPGGQCSLEEILGVEEGK